MSRTRRRTLFAFAVAASVLAVSPASAFNWACTVKDKAGDEYVGRAFGLSNDWTKNFATSVAMRKCETAGGKSCALDECTDLDAQYSQ